jgi:hypothetical protein
VRGSTEERIELLRIALDAQFAGIEKARRDLRELEEVNRETLREWMDLVTPRASRSEGKGTTP